MVCPHCGKDPTARPPTLAEVIGPARYRELIDQERAEQEQIIERRAWLRRRRWRRPTY